MHYSYGNIHIIKGGSLIFSSAQIDFWAKSIIIENGGQLPMNSSAAPIGTAGRGPPDTAQV
jgi:hypothetical protein